jgi:hypothetical protein
MCKLAPFGILEIFVKKHTNLGKKDSQSKHLNLHNNVAEYYYIGEPNVMSNEASHAHSPMPIKTGRFGTLTHHYKQHGTTCLFAALNVLDGTVIGTCYPRHRHEEFLKFLRKIDRETPPGLALHLILDNYGTHNHPQVKQWLKKHRRFHLHCTPTSASWMNLVKRWFG